MPFSDGAWFGPKDGLFKMWYLAGNKRSTCYATSKDGLHWEKPALDMHPGTNVVLPAGSRDSSTVWLDHDTTDPGAAVQAHTISARLLEVVAAHLARRHPLGWPDVVRENPRPHDDVLQSVPPDVGHQPPLPRHAGSGRLQRRPARAAHPLPEIF